MSGHRGRRLVYIPTELLEEITEASLKDGKAVTKFVEEGMRQAVRVSRAGYDLEAFARFFEVLQAQRILGGAFVPIEVLNYLTTKASRDNKKDLMQKWFESGLWHGRYLKERFGDPLQALRDFLEAVRWDLNEVQAVNDERGVRIICISTVLTSEGTETLSEFIVGAMHSLGYKIDEADNIKGMISLQFVLRLK